MKRRTGLLIFEVIEWAWAGWLVTALVVAYRETARPTLLQGAAFGSVLFFFLPWQLRQAWARTRERRDG